MRDHLSGCVDGAPNKRLKLTGGEGGARPAQAEARGVLSRRPQFRRGVRRTRWGCERCRPAHRTAGRQEEA
jgi:hypothetical protein